MGENPEKIVNRISFVSVAGNAALTAFKLLAGVLGSSGAMISDGVHSFSDIITTVIAYVGTLLASKKEDHAHPYGHERIASVAALVLSGLLLATGLGIGFAGIRSIFTGLYKTAARPGAIALAAAVVSIAVKESMYRYTRHYAEILQSDAFLADAWHHRSDALSSIGSLIGIGGAMLGAPVLDPAASVVICGFISKAAWDIGKDALNKLLDTRCSDEYEAGVRMFVEAQPEVCRVDVLRSRMFGNRVYLDLEIAMDGGLSLEQAHAAAEEVHDRIEKAYPGIKHVMIHVNPL